jgi:hypothetical protein
MRLLSSTCFGPNHGGSFNRSDESGVTAALHVALSSGGNRYQPAAIWPTSSGGIHKGEGSGDRGHRSG